MMKFLTTRLSMLKMLLKSADFKVRKALAEGLVLSKVNYCIAVCGTTNSSVMQKLHVFMNNIVRVLYGIGRNRFHSLIPLSKGLKWLTVRETLRYHVMITLHSIIQNQTPKDIAQKFKEHEHHSHDTRNSRQRFRLNPETTSLNATRSTGFACRAAREYRNLPSLISESICLPRWDFKDYCRSQIGGWSIKERTDAVILYLEEQKRRNRVF